MNFIYTKLLTGSVFLFVPKGFNTQEPAHRFAGELQGVLEGIKPLSATTPGEQHTSSLQGEVVDSHLSTGISEIPPGGTRLAVMSHNDKNLVSLVSIEAFPKLQFWESNLKIRSFIRLKA
jgi:hypothetical protein